MKSCLDNEQAIIRLPSEQRNKVKFRSYKTRWFDPDLISFDLEFDKLRHVSPMQETASLRHKLQKEC